MMTLIHQLNDDDIAAKIRGAKQRVLYAAPGLDSLIATALIAANQKMGANKVSVIVDPDPMICRFGYGTIDDLQMLHEQGVQISKENNLRLSFLIVDNEGYVFTKPALLIESYEEGERTPNAMKLNDQQILSVVQATCPALLESDQKNESKNRDREIGKNNITEAEIEKAKQDIDTNPHQKYEISRKVRVFQSELLFVELEFPGSKGERKAVSLPLGIRRIIERNAGTGDRLDSRYKLRDSHNDPRIESIGKRVTELRKRYLHEIGDYGKIMRRKHKKKFESQVNQLIDKLAELNDDLTKTDPEMPIQFEHIVSILMPLVKQATPRILGVSPTDQMIEHWIEDECQRQLEGKGTTPNIRCVFKDVTYETLRKQEFRKQARIAFPELAAIFDEFDAVRASEGPVMNELTES